MAGANEPLSATHGDADGRAEETERAAGAAPLEQEVSGAVEFLDAVVAFPLFF